MLWHSKNALITIHTKSNARECCRRFVAAISQSFYRMKIFLLKHFSLQRPIVGDCYVFRSRGRFKRKIFHIEVKNLFLNVKKEKKNYERFFLCKKERKRNFKRKKLLVIFKAHQRLVAHQFIYFFWCSEDKEFF